MSLLGNSNQFTLAAPYRFIPRRFVGYFDYFVLRILFNGNAEKRTKFISHETAQVKYDFIHCLEFQGAGYLIRGLPRAKVLGPKFIVTNWGSDIYFFQNNESDLVKIKATLSRADLYSGECERDYALATKYGFRGEFLPCIPNAGGFDEIPSPYDPKGHLINKTSERDWVICKTYGGQFGRGDLILDEVEKVLKSQQNWNFYFYSVTEDLEERTSGLQKLYPDKVSFSTRANGITRRELMDYFAKARVYIGASRTDGISTSFLEALTRGAFPIQTDTSCANEWVKKGVMARIISNDAIQLHNVLNEALTNDSLVDEAQIANYSASIKHLSSEVIRKEALTFYR